MLARPHPVFGDWCYCQPGDSQRLLDRQLSYRDAALKEDPEFSGMPSAFEQWCSRPQQSLGLRGSLSVSLNA